MAKSKKLTTASSTSSNLQKFLTQSEVALERAKKKEKQQKTKLKAANKNLSKTELKILKLEYERAKYRRKARKSAFKIANLRLKQWHKAQEETEEKAYTVVSDKKEKKSRTPKLVIEKESVNLEEKRTPTKHSRATKEKESETLQPRAASVKKIKVDDSMMATTPIPLTPEKIEVVAKTRQKRRSSEEIKALKDAEASTLNGDDFRIVEGIGLRVTQALHEHGIKTFKQLSETRNDLLKNILVSIPNRFADPSTWAEQALMIVENRQEDLLAWQKTLKRGKRVTN